MTKISFAPCVRQLPCLARLLFLTRCASEEVSCRHCQKQSNRMLKKQSLPLLIALVLMIPLTVFALAKWAGNKSASLPVYKDLRKGFTDFWLTNQEGRTVTYADWKGKIVVVDFFFSHCPSICPRMTKNLKMVQQAFAGCDHLLLNSFSVDPARDSAQRLKAYAVKFGIGVNWNFLTGNKADIYRLARKDFLVTATEGDGSAKDFIHSDKLVLIDRHQRIRGYYEGTSDKSVQQLIEAIKKLEDEK